MSMHNGFSCGHIIHHPLVASSAIMVLVISKIQRTDSLSQQSWQRTPPTNMWWAVLLFFYFENEWCFFLYQPAALVLWFSENISYEAQTIVAGINQSSVGFRVLGFRVFGSKGSKKNIQQFGVMFLWPRLELTSFC
jgi:hypothetical protein